MYFQLIFILLIQLTLTSDEKPLKGKTLKGLTSDENKPLKGLG
jgi:hypothetical protein